MGTFHRHLEAVRSAAVPVEHGVPADDKLFALVGDARLVLIGEATHGTHEFYAARAAMTRRLVEERGFTAVVAEADWPDAYRVNCHVRGRGDDRDAAQALGDFARFPTWMWRNTVMVDFVDWLRRHNEASRDPVGFYGMDLYSLHRSAHEVIAYLDRVDPAAAARARERYSCLDHRGGAADPTGPAGPGDSGASDGSAAAFGAGGPCERAVVEQLVDLCRQAPRYALAGGVLAQDELFHAELNARVVQAAERYYRSMFRGRVSTWNLRDRHMVDTVDALAGHLGRRRGERPRMVVWAHNSHLGDARATALSGLGELNVGQLVRERHPGDCRLVGFTTYDGTVTAADEWGGPADRKRVRPALPGSVEDLFHATGQNEFMISFDRSPQATEALRSSRLERAIGVIYRPRTERQSHYFDVRLAEQFDAVIHVDRTSALRPLERTPRWDAGDSGADAPETYPFAV